MPRNNWTREELVVTLALYFKLPFGRLNRSTKEVIELAKIIGRTPSAVALRLTNYAACDPYIINSGRHGMSGGLHTCKPIWDEYQYDHEKLFLDAEVYLAKMKKESIETHLHLSEPDFTGKDKLAVIKQRVNQDAFRAMILSNYDYRCAITGMDVQSLLIASHIIPWADNESERLNPENGICLSPLYDKAFDKGLIGIQPDYEIVLSKELKEHSKEDFFALSFAGIEHTRLILPQEHQPNPAFLQYHYDNIFAEHN